MGLEIKFIGNRGIRALLAAAITVAAATGEYRLFHSTQLKDFRNFVVHCVPPFSELPPVAAKTLLVKPVAKLRSGRYSAKTI
jgi:hypothetical protein